MKDATSWVYGLQHSGGMASLSANATQLQFLDSGPHLVKRRRVRWYIWVVGRLELPCIESSLVKKRQWPCAVETPSTSLLRWR